MCGICGISWRDKRLIARMTKRIAYRGPDGHGTFADRSVSLGHRRLSIIDLSSRGKQPMRFRRRKRDYAITFNGEIYNYMEIREELQRKGYKFHSTTDTEVLLAAYDAWGQRMLHLLNGMFAFCIYDMGKRQLFLARDRFGMKPLYYADDVQRDGKRAGGFAFSSEINGLRNLVIKPELDPEGVRQFFTFRFTLGETTMLRGIKKLLPGHSLIYDLQKRSIIEKKRYYTFAPRLSAPQRPKYPYSWYRKTLKEELEAAVRRWMVADVPVACFLSGGIDSSVLALLAKRYNPRLHTFTMGFETTNELPYARMVAQYLGTEHHEIMLHRENILEYLDDMIAHMDEPIGDPGFLPVFALSKEVVKHNKVVLSGDGGDEVLTGYDRYKLLHYGMKLRHAAVCDFGSDILGRLKAMRGKDGYHAFLEIICLFDEKELKKLGIRAADAGDAWQAAATGQASLVETAQAFDIATLLPGDFFMKADKMSSAFGLEQRTPFLDHTFAEFAFSIPLNHKLRRWNEKAILKDAYKDELPREITKRRKHGFNVPIDYWFKNVLNERLRKLLSHDDNWPDGKRPYEKSYIYELLDRMSTKDGGYKENFILAQKLWSILIFELWYKQVFPRPLQNSAERKAAHRKKNPEILKRRRAAQREANRKREANGKRQ